MTAREPSRNAANRPSATLHSKETLEALASEVRKHADEIAAVAQLLDEASQGRAAKVNYDNAVRKGLSAIRLLVGDVEKKIEQRKFVAVTPPDEPRVIKRKKA